MVAATDYELPGLIRTANFDSMSDARLFSLINELAEREKRRDALLDRMALDESDAIEAAAKKACDGSVNICADRCNQADNSRWSAPSARTSGERLDCAIDCADRHDGAPRDR